MRHHFLLSNSKLVCLEGVVFFLLALGLFGFQQACAPNLSLIFDSQGYLAVAGALQKLYEPKFLTDVAQYVLSGFPEGSRLEILNKMGDAFDVVWTGPVLPLLLSVIYDFLGKSASLQNWYVGSSVMLVISALIVSFIWATAREIWGTRVARLAALLALCYPPLAINSGRILSDVCACLAAAMMLYLLMGLVHKEKTFGILPSGMVHGLFTGLAAVLLMLSKPPLMFLPWVALGEIIILAIALKIPSVINRKWIIGLLLGCLIGLAPWVLLRQIVTGEASIVVDRGGAYNFWVGCNLATDGWDALPSRLVAHPKEFKKSKQEVVSEIANSFKLRPLAFIDLMARKPARLVGAPWNDFQNAFLYLSWPVQKWWQLTLLLMAAMGAFFTIRIGAASREFKVLAPAVVLSTFVLYFLIYIPVIAMSRYFYPAAPALILLATQGISWLVKERHRRTFQMLVLASLALPLILCLLDPSVPMNNRWLGNQAAFYGVGNVSLFGSTIIVVGIALWYCLLSLCTGKLARLESLRLINERHGRLAAIVCCLAKVVPLFLLLGTLVCAAASARQELFCLESSQELVDSQKLPVTIFVPKQTHSRRWLLVVDAIAKEGQSTHAPEISVTVNDKEINDNLRPLWALDGSQRDNLVYLRNFAYAQGKNIEDIRQWWCVSVPDSAICPGEKNRIVLNQLGQLDKDINTIVFSDFVTAGAEGAGHSLSLRNFSWSKGSFGDCVGEMRLSNVVRPHGITSVWFKAPKLRRRVRLVAVDDAQGDIAFADTEFSMPGSSIGPKQTHQVIDRTLTYQLLSDFNQACLSAGKPIAALLQTEIAFRAPDSPGQASACLIETLNGGGQSPKQFAPMAPGVLEARSNLRKIQFEDIVPLLIAGQGPPARLLNVRLLMAGVPWWDLLAYDRFKSKTVVQFENAILRLKPIRIFNLDQQKWDQYLAEPI